MKRLMLVIGLLSGLVAGVAQGEPTTGEGSPLPDESESDMRIRFATLCHNACWQENLQCADACWDQYEGPRAQTCDRDCNDDLVVCGRRCENIWGCHC